MPGEPVGDGGVVPGVRRVAAVDLAEVTPGSPTMGWRTAGAWAPMARPGPVSLTWTEIDAAAGAAAGQGGGHLQLVDADRGNWAVPV